MSHAEASGKPSAAIDATTVADLLRLTNRLHKSSDGPPQRKRLLLEGLSTVIRADAGVCVVAHLDGDKPPHIVSRATTGRTPRASSAKRPRPSASGDHPLLHALLPALAAPADSGDSTASVTFADPRMLLSTVRLSNRHLVAGLSLARFGRRHHPFSPADQIVLQLFHAEMRWVYDLDLPLASPDVLSLSRRPREILQYLLGGHGEKQIAAALNRSPNTIHHHVKQLYRHFNVSSRSELLSRWVK
jgi:DNA-binding CsgD family transcriptional regulator